MRPLRLELEGFGPYRERQAVDFSDVELFAITGPTGSGKSTLLDAIAFALYGQVPRVGRQVGTLKHPAAAKAWVSLTFRVGERVYRVERSRSEKRGDARVYLLEGGERLLDLPTLEAVNRALADLVGLDYEAFTRALLLPQGEFDRFLSLANYRVPQKCVCGVLAKRVIKPTSIAVDYPGYTCPVSGEWVDGKRAHEANLKKHNCRVLEPGETAAATHSCAHCTT